MRRLSPAAPDIKPTSVGPPEQPRSPASAISANIAVPPAGSALTPVENAPGHIMPTEKPHTPQPIKPSTGLWLRPASR